VGIEHLDQDMVDLLLLHFALISYGERISFRAADPRRNFSPGPPQPGAVTSPYDGA
jgi:hypothetical protein